MHLRGPSVGIIETLPIFKDRNSRRTKHKQHTQMLAYKEINELVHKSGKSPQLFPLSNRVPHSNTKQIGVFQRKSPEQRGNKVSGCTHQSDLPYCMEPVGSQMPIPCSSRQAPGQPVPLQGTLKGSSSGQVVPGTARALPENSSTKRGGTKAKHFLVPISLWRGCVHFFLPVVLHRWAWMFPVSITKVF